MTIVFLSLWEVSKAPNYRDEAAIKALGQRIRDLRKQRGMTIEEFANTIGLHATQLGRIERGENNVTVSYLYRLADSLGVEPALLVRGGY